MLLAKINDDEEFASGFFGSKLVAMIPIFMAQIKGAFECTLDAEAVADILGMPQAEMA